MKTQNALEHFPFLCTARDACLAPSHNAYSRGLKPAARHTLSGNALAWIIVLVGVWGGGCASDLPTYQWVDGNTALGRLGDRSTSVKTLSSRCRLILTTADGASTQLDGAIVARPPAYFRIRAWKLSQPALDLTMTPEGLWVFPAGDHSRDDRQPEGFLSEVTGDLTGEHLAEAWSLLMEGFVDESWKSVDEADRSVFRVAKTVDGSEMSTVCLIDRSTLTVRECTLTDEQGSANLTLTFDRYRRVDDVVWPMRMEARSSQGSMTVLFDNVGINKALPSTAFVPPRRAVKRR